MFETIVNADGTIQIVPVSAGNQFPFKSMSELAAENSNLNSFPAPLNVSDFPANTFDDQVNFAPRQIPLRNLGFNTSFGVANEPDVKQEFLPDQKEDSGIMKLLKFLIPGSNLASFLPKSDPRTIGIQNFYGNKFGLDNIGRVSSGIMAGYNPVSGGFLNRITKGRYGEPTQFGLANAMQRRIERILGRKLPQTDASRAKVADLRALQSKEMQDRFDRGESLASIGKSTFTGPGMAFEKRKTGTGKGPR